MELRHLVAALPKRKSAVYTFERGQTARHPHAALHDDVLRTRDFLSAWGVKQGSRVGIYAPNSYAWLVHDLALIELGKYWFYRSYRPPAEPAVRRPVPRRRVYRRAARFTTRHRLGPQSHKR